MEKEFIERCLSALGNMGHDAREVCTSSEVVRFELLQQVNISQLERVERIELSSSAWKPSEAVAFSMPILTNWCFSAP